MDENTRKLIASNLRAARWKRDWSQAFVARQMGISIRTLSRAENHGTLSETLLKKLCLFYQIPLASIYMKKELQTREAVKVDVIPSDVAARIVLQSDLVNDIQREAILRFNDISQKLIVINRITDLKQSVRNSIFVVSYSIKCVRNSIGEVSKPL